MSPDQRSRDVEQPLWRAHLGLVGSLLVAGSVLFRVLGVTRGDLNAAFAILGSANSAEVVVGSIASVMLVLGPLAAAVVLYFLWSADRMNRSVPFPHQVAMAIFLVAIIALSPLDYLAIGVGCLVLAAARRIWIERRPVAVESEPTETGPSDRTALIFFVIGLTVIAMYVLPPWWPSEVIEVEGGPTVVGYVIATEGGDLIVLDEERRHVLRIEGTSVRSRAYCKEPNALDGSSSLMDLGRGGDPYIRCPGR